MEIIRNDHFVFFMLMYGKLDTEEVWIFGGFFAEMNSGLSLENALLPGEPFQLLECQMY